MYHRPGLFPFVKEIYCGKGNNTPSAEDCFYQGIPWWSGDLPYYDMYMTCIWHVYSIYTFTYSYYYCAKLVANGSTKTWSCSVRLGIQPSKLSRMYRVQQQQRTSNKQNGLGDIPKCPWKTPCVYIFVGLCHNFLVGVPLSCWWNSHCCWLAPNFCLIEIHTCCSVKLPIFTGYILVFLLVQCRRFARQRQSITYCLQVQ